MPASTVFDHSPRTALRRTLLGAGTVTAVAAAMFLAPLSAQAAVGADPGDDDFLGVVEVYAIVSADTITDTATHGTEVIGDVALTPGTDQQLLVVQVVGDIHVGDTDADTANLDLNTAYVILANTPLSETVGTVNLAARVTPYGAGVYFSGSDLLLDGTMFLDGGADDVFVFQASTGSLTVMAGSVVQLLGAVQACNVYWQVGSSATLGVDSTFVGSLLAATSIAAQDGAQITGQLLAGSSNAGAVTLDDNFINSQSGCVRPTSTERIAAAAAGGTGGTGGTTGGAGGTTGGTGGTAGTAGTGGTGGTTGGTSGGTGLGSRVVAGGVPVATGPTALARTGVDVGGDIIPLLLTSILLALAGFGAVIIARRPRAVQDSVGRTASRRTARAGQARSLSRVESDGKRSSSTPPARMHSQVSGSVVSGVARHDRITPWPTRTTVPGPTGCTTSSSPISPCPVRNT